MTPETLLRVPRLGESVNEARILLFCKRPGDPVIRDEPLLEIETDKAAYVMESPEDGVLDRWEVEPGIVLPVGHVIGAIRSAPQTRAARNDVLSPRTRAWCRDHGIDRETIEQVRARIPDRTLTISDFEQQPAQALFRDVPFTMRRKALNAAFERARQDVVPAWIEVELAADLISAARCSHSVAGRRLATIEVLSWAVVQAMCACPAFRSECRSDMWREYADPVLGVSVALPDDELGTAVVRGSDNIATFAAELKEQISLTKAGCKSPLRPHVLLSYVGPLGITRAMPVVVPPAVATLSIGAYRQALDPTGKRMVKSAAIVLGFDHRVCNGAGAAGFLKRVIEALKALCPND